MYDINAKGAIDVSPFYQTLMLLIVAILIVGFIVTVLVGRRQRSGKDHDVSSTRQKHTILANPIFYLYILFPLAVLIGAYILYVASGDLTK
jgi:hypothetical protein